MKRLLCLALALLGASAPLRSDPADPGAAAPAGSRLAEPEATEVVVVINHNALGGTHAGLFAGARLSDPSGSYVAERSRDPAWRAPSLDDYVRYQLEDGEDVRIYRFRLDPPDFAVIDERVRSEGATAPLFCAATVQNHIAGVGPFARIAPVWWTSPAALAARLDELIRALSGHAVCLRPGGLPC